jgi:hypothetical protein
VNRRSALGHVVAFVAIAVACGESGSDSESDQGGASGSAGAGASSGGSADGGSPDDGGRGGSAGNAGRGGSAGNVGRGGSAGNAGRGGSAGASGASGNGGASGSSGNAGTGGVGELCADRTGGALVEFSIADETLRVWIENSAFVSEAERLLAAGESRIPVFNTLLDGRDCDAQWSWHPDSADVEFADFTIELCDGIPSYIEENKAEWLDTVGAYCPWSATVSAVTRR